VKNLLLLIILLFPVLSFSQEQWSTLNINGNLNNKWNIAVEGEQRYSYSLSKVRYFHFDAGIIRKLSSKWRLGFFYREIYEIKNNIRVTEFRPHVDAFYNDNKHWKARIRMEYQIREIGEDGWRFRIRPNYDFKLFKNFDPYIQTELNFTKDGLTRNRLNTGITINYHQLQIQPGYLLESIYKNTWNHTNVVWINTKLIFN
jgi:hypothetical protein